MPPKVISRNRRSQQPPAQLVLIYDMLADKENQDAVRNVCKKIQSVMEHEAFIVEKSFLIFILRVCGLDSCIEKMDWREPIASLKDLLEQLCQQNQRTVYVNQLLIINVKSKFHKQFANRVDKFLQIAISDQLPLLTQTQIMKNTYEALAVISKSKMRNARHCSVVISNLLIKRIKQFYDILIQSKNSKRAKKLMDLIDQGYLNNIIKPRFKDIDLQIRQKSFQIMGEAIVSCADQLLNSKKLSQLYTQSLKDNKAKIIQLCLKSLIKLFEADRLKMNHNTVRKLVQYANQVVKPLQELALLPNRNSCLAMDALISIHCLDSNLNALKPKIIAKIFEIHGYEKFHDGLKKAVSIFFKSLVKYSDKQQLKQQRTTLITQITHLLCSINSSKLLQNILHQFFGFYPNMFSFDDMFLLLFTEYYHRDGSDIQLQQNQLNVICTMICQFCKYLRENKRYSERQKQQDSFNKNVLTNCKEIYYQKIRKHSNLSSLYLRLFSNINFPISSTVENYLQFVQQKTLDLIRQQKYLTISGDNIVQVQKIIHECACILSVIYLNQNKNNKIVKNFRLLQLIDKQTFNDVQIVKLAASCSRFNLQQIRNEKILKKLINSYNRSHEKVIKLQALLYAYHVHRWMFTELFTQPTQPKYDQYISIRTGYLQFVIKIVLASNSQDNIVRLAAFNIICRTFKLCCNTKISDLHNIYYEPSVNEMEILYDFVAQHVHFGEQANVSQTSMMMANMSLQNNDARDHILFNIFSLFNESFKISLNKFSIQFLCKFLLTENSILIKSAGKYIQSFMNQLIKTEISSDYNNKFVYWKVCHEILLQIGLSEEQKCIKIINKFIDSYYKYKKGQNHTKELLSNKLMLFVADSMDKYTNSSNIQGLNIVKIILSKIYRRFPKQTLQRLLIFFNSKIQHAQDQKPFKSIKQYLSKISKTGKKTNKKQEQQQQQDERQSESSQEDEMNSRSIKMQANNEEDQQQQNIDRSNKNTRIQKSPNLQNKGRRETRSNTKMTRKKN